MIRSSSSHSLRYHMLGLDRIFVLGISFILGATDIHLRAPGDVSSHSHWQVFQMSSCGSWIPIIAIFTTPLC